MTKRDKTRHKKPDDAKALRNAAIMADAASGMKTEEIGDKYGIGRQAVSKILNSEEAKAIIKRANSRVTELIDSAVDVMADSLGVVTDPTNRLKAALAILKNAGVIKERIDMNHTFPKPVVIKRRDGSEVVLGTEQDVEEKE